MKIKEKKCKGTGKAKGYGCNTMQLKRTYGLGHNCGCYRDWLLNSEEGKKKLEKTTLKACSTRLSLEKAIKDKQDRNKITDHLKNTKTVVHEMVRLRDKWKPCISCNAPYKDNFQAGHFYSANNYRSIKFDFFNIHGQCEKCNLMKDGNFSEYSLRLPERIGQEEFDKLKERALADKKMVKKWTKEELKQIRIEARKIIKSL